MFGLYELNLGYLEMQLLKFDSLSKWNHDLRRALFFYIVIDVSTGTWIYSENIWERV